MSKPLLSVCLITYNHKNYIAQAIESVLMQRVNFEFEIIIADDCSTDGTREIVQKYHQLHPGLIKLILQPKNIGPAENWMQLITRPDSKYIAYFEGDDYWTDKYKLQRQVDFLEANNDFAICFHRVYELKQGQEPQISTLNVSEREETYSIEDLAKGNFIHTPSVVFRRQMDELPSWFLESPVGDYPLYMLHAQFGKIKYLPEPMSVYRRHVNGIWGQKAHLHQLTGWVKMLEFLIAEIRDLATRKLLQQQKVETALSIGNIHGAEGNYEKYNEWLNIAADTSFTFFAEKFNATSIPKYRPLRKLVGEANNKTGKKLHHDTKLKCCVVVPVYKAFNDLSKEEFVSLNRLYTVLGKRQICFIGPKKFNWTGYLDHAGERSVFPEVKEFTGTYFDDISGYNRLLISSHFLEQFKDVKHILLYQLDAFVFRDDLVYWCNRDYDYIGAPWTGMYIYNDMPLIGTGNGGFSLRKINKSYQLLRKLRYQQVLERYSNFNWKGIVPKLPKLIFELLRSGNVPSRFEVNYHMQEDVFWCKSAPDRLNSFRCRSTMIKLLSKALLKNNFRVAPVEESVEFSFEASPEKLYQLTNGRLPFGCHGWEKYQPSFWKQFILEGGHVTKSNEPAFYISA